MNFDVNNLLEAIALEKDTSCEIFKVFSKIYGATADSMSLSVKERTACRIVSKKMVHDGLSKRKGHVGILLKTLWQINDIKIESEDDFLEGLHTASSELYFYEFGYRSSALKEVTIVDRNKRCLVTKAREPESDECVLYDTAIPVNETGRCVLSEETS